MRGTDYIFYNPNISEGDFMKKLLLLCGLMYSGVAGAANVTLYYSPTCPHCHHAREFLSNTLVYEYPDVNVTYVNVMEQTNLELFKDALKKCKFSNGGIPVLVIGDKCEQGYADFMQDDLRKYVEADLTDEQKAVAAANKKALAENAEKFKSENAERAKKAQTEYVSNDVTEKKSQKKSDSNNTVWFWGLMIILIAGLGYTLVRGDKNKK